MAISKEVAEREAAARKAAQIEVDKAVAAGTTGQLRGLAASLFQSVVPSKSRTKGGLLAIARQVLEDGPEGELTPHEIVIRAQARGYWASAGKTAHQTLRSELTSKDAHSKAPQFSKGGVAGTWKLRV